MKITAEKVLHLEGVGFFKQGDSLRGLTEYKQIDGTHFFIALANDFTNEIFASLFKSENFGEIGLSIIMASPNLLDSFKKKEDKKDEH